MVPHARPYHPALWILAVLILIGLWAVPVMGGQELMDKEVMKGRVMAKSKYPFDETVSRLKQAIEGQNLMVIHSIDQQAMLRMAGVEAKGMQSILFFHPQYGKMIYQTDRRAGIEPPLKIVVMEGDMGTMISYYKPSYVFGRYPGLVGLGQELDGVLARIAEALTK